MALQVHTIPQNTKESSVRINIMNHQGPESYCEPLFNWTRTTGPEPPAVIINPDLLCLVVLVSGRSELICRGWFHIQTEIRLNLIELKRPR